jgi:hypothetical protein
MRISKRNNARLLVAVIGVSGAVAIRAIGRDRPATGRARRRGEQRQFHSVGSYQRYDDADDGGAVDQRTGTVTHRRTGAGSAIATGFPPTASPVTASTTATLGTSHPKFRILTVSASSGGFHLHFCRPPQGWGDRQATR